MRQIDHSLRHIDLVAVSTLSHRLAAILAVAYFAALAAILFWPSPVDKPASGALTDLIDWLHGHGIPEWLVGYSQIEFSANILLFVPFGAILTLRLHRRLWWWTVPIAAGVSGLVELAQGAFLPQRFPSLLDVVANTSGAFLGALLVLFIWSMRRRRALRMAQDPT